MERVQSKGHTGGLDSLGLAYGNPAPRPRTARPSKREEATHSSPQPEPPQLGCTQGRYKGTDANFFSLDGRARFLSGIRLIPTSLPARRTAPAPPGGTMCTDDTHGGSVVSPLRTACCAGGGGCYGCRTALLRPCDTRSLNDTSLA